MYWRILIATGLLLGGLPGFGASADASSSKSAKSEKSKDTEETYQYNFDVIPDWFGYLAHNDFEIGLDKSEKHTGAASGYIKSIAAKPREFGNLQQAFVPNNYLGKRVKMTAWIKTKLTSGTAQLWVRVDGDWKDSDTKPGCFDNMDDRPIKGTTDWTEYTIVVDVPENGSNVAFGLMLIGTGEIWLDDVSFATVGKEVPLTGKYATLTGCGKKEPLNLDFERVGD